MKAVKDDGDGELRAGGGCSCDGSGSWSFCKDEEEAMRLVPEQERQ